MGEKNEIIARKVFATLVLDYDFPAFGDIPAYVSCRVLHDGYFVSRMHAGSVDEAIERFYRGDYERR